jgi:hypothetical protein
MSDSTQPRRCECRGTYCGTDHGFRCAQYLGLELRNIPTVGDVWMCAKCRDRLERKAAKRPTRQHLTPQMADDFRDCSLPFAVVKGK